MTNPVVLAVDVGGTKLAAALVDDDGRVLARGQVPTPTSPGATAEAVMAALAGVVRDVQAGWGAGPPVAVGVGSAGPLDARRGTVAPVNIPAWRDFPLADRLGDLVPGARVTLAGDGLCFALGEHWRGAAQGSDALLGIVVSTGVGGGLVLGGRPLPGSTGNAGHLGHVPVPGGSDRCVCGGRGCLETLASGPAMVRWAGEQGWKPPPGHPADGRSLTAAARDDDPVAIEAIARSGRALAHSVVAAAAVCDLGDVVVGGGLSAAGDLLLGPLRRGVLELAGLAFVRRVRVHRAELGSDAGLVGAGALAFDAPPA